MTATNTILAFLCSALICGTTIVDAHAGNASIQNQDLSDHSSHAPPKWLLTVIEDLSSGVQHHKMRDFESAEACVAEGDSLTAQKNRFSCSFRSVQGAWAWLPMEATRFSVATPDAEHPLWGHQQWLLSVWGARSIGDVKNVAPGSSMNLNLASPDLCILSGMRLSMVEGSSFACEIVLDGAWKRHPKR